MLINQLLVLWSQPQQRTNMVLLFLLHKCFNKAFSSIIAVFCCKITAWNIVVGYAAVAGQDQQCADALLQLKTQPTADQW
jgi:positive regulator of sigma E activity